METNVKDVEGTSWILPSKSGSNMTMTQLGIANLLLISHPNIEQSLHNRDICAELHTAELYVVRQNEKTLRSVIIGVILSYPDV